MERLKTVLADKILDLSSADSVNVKIQIEKIQRFRDFANACQSLMLKYPTIENELIQMANDGDFDTKVASSRVDSIIRLSESGQPIDHTQNNEPAEPMEEIGLSDSLPVSVLTGEETIYDAEEDTAVDGSMDTDQTAGGISENNAGDASSNISDIEYVEQQDDYTRPHSEDSKTDRKEQTKRVLQIVGIVVAVVLIIFIIKFVILYWDIILYSLGGLAVLAIVIWLMKRKKS